MKHEKTLGLAAACTGKVQYQDATARITATRTGKVQAEYAAGKEN